MVWCGGGKTPRELITAADRSTRTARRLCNGKTVIYIYIYIYNSLNAEGMNVVNIGSELCLINQSSGKLKVTTAGLCIYKNTGRR